MVRMESVPDCGRHLERILRHRGQSVGGARRQKPAAAMPAFPEGTKSTTMTSGGRRKVHYTFPDESEMVEEFDVQTDALVVRKRRSRTLLGGQGEWSFEVGEPSARVTIEGDTLRPSAANPVLVRVDRPHAFEWRIRNLPYPKATYSVSIDHEQRQVVVRTANKKYFKRIDIADLDRARLPLEEEALSWTHEPAGAGTLVLTYRKPAPILKLEKELKLARHQQADEPVVAAGVGGEQPPDCKQQ